MAHDRHPVHGRRPLRDGGRTRWVIADSRNRKTVLEFRGTVDYDYAPPGWEHTGTDGVRHVELYAGYALVFRGADPVRYALPPRTITNDEIDRLLGAFAPFTDARGRYRYEVDWSSEVSIPRWSIDEKHAAMMEAWESLCAVLDELGLRDVPAHDLRWPARVRGGRARIEALRPWMEGAGHLATRPEP